MNISRTAAAALLGLGLAGGIGGTAHAGNFTQSNFTQSNFTQSNFTQSNFTQSNFTQSNFTQSNFTQSNFTQSKADTPANDQDVIAFWAEAGLFG
ncbi:pentapeptide repeat-containing protein [Austwickia chelonae]|uniref:pentapeptide repeat-containing protein n=1 Tax=Austwickia chelonae TaxID=100225 RepID=UPI00196804E2|nr:pentapeptide repeat-containing protein [Austwickia chelonae]